MGRANTKENGISCSYVVARYKEAGNIVEQYEKNVFKGNFTKDMCDNRLDIITDLPRDNIGNKIKDDISNINDNAEGEMDSVETPLNEFGLQTPNYHSGGGKRYSTETSFGQNGLKAHNKFRDIHGSTYMKIDPTLSKDAELYAKELAKIGGLIPSMLDNVGENLAFNCSSDENYVLTAAEVTRRW